MIESCVKCAAPAATVMSFSYGERIVCLDDLVEGIALGTYAMCDEHAGRLTPPVGWQLVDRRTAPRRLFASLEVA
jgi:hypothetical protein